MRTFANDGSESELLHGGKHDPRELLVDTRAGVKQEAQIPETETRPVLKS